MRGRGMKPLNAEAVLKRITDRKQLVSRLKVAYTRSGVRDPDPCVTIDGVTFHKSDNPEFVSRLRDWLYSEINRLERLIKRDARRIEKWK